MGKGRLRNWAKKVWGWTIVGLLRHRLRHGKERTAASCTQKTETEPTSLTRAAKTCHPTFHHATDEKDQSCYLQAKMPRFSRNKWWLNRPRQPSRQTSKFVQPTSPTSFSLYSWFDKSRRPLGGTRGNWAKWNMLSFSLSQWLRPNRPVHFVY